MCADIVPALSGNRRLWTIYWRSALIVIIARASAAGNPARLLEVLLFAAAICIEGAFASIGFTSVRGEPTMVDCRMSRSALDESLYG
jgi:hypothetical protein